MIRIAVLVHGSRVEAELGQPSRRLDLKFEGEEVARGLHFIQRGLRAFLICCPRHDQPVAAVLVREDDEHGVLHGSKSLPRLEKVARLLLLQLAVQQDELLRVLLATEAEVEAVAHRRVSAVASNEEFSSHDPRLHCLGVLQAGLHVVGLLLEADELGVVGDRGVLLRALAPAAARPAPPTLGGVPMVLPNGLEEERLVLELRVDEHGGVRRQAVERPELRRELLPLAAVD
mmetsp:Transcript_23427/g.49996  ORF Transcript_23427/g.49996 Transcript_23427/m.49996 type:complete len:231 (-) Transcript_23427:305-997(-)